jgi:hypothetical protein
MDGRRGIGSDKDAGSNGHNDIKSIEKDVIAVVACSFAVE